MVGNKSKKNISPMVVNFMVMNPTVPNKTNPRRPLHPPAAEIKIKEVLFKSHSCAEWDWNIYTYMNGTNFTDPCLFKFVVNVGTYSSPMEHMGMISFLISKRLSFTFFVAIRFSGACILSHVKKPRWFLGIGIPI